MASGPSDLETGQDSRARDREGEDSHKRCTLEPSPPKEPDPHECCGNGCENCVWTTYFERLAEYEESVKRGAVKPNGVLPK
jgi:hypothetical protein